MNKWIVIGVVVIIGVALILSRYDVGYSPSGTVYVASRDTSNVYFCLGNRCENLPRRSRY